jgi:hypothetical protein
VSDQHDVRRIARALPETTEDGHCFRAGGKLFVWFYPERVHPKKPRVINYEVVVVAVPTLEDKGALIAGDPETFFTTDHYNGYKTVLVRLARLGAGQLRELIRAGWAAAAPPAVRSRHEGAPAGKRSRSPAAKTARAKPARRSPRGALTRGRSKARKRRRHEPRDADRARRVTAKSSHARTTRILSPRVP